MNALRLPLLTSLTLLIAAAPAAAQAPTPTPTPTPIVPGTTPTPTPTPPVATPTPASPVAAKGDLRLKAKGLYKDSGKRVGLTRQLVEVRGILRPAMAGQKVVVKLTHGSKTLKTRRATTAADGRFTLKLKLRSAGRLRIRGQHKPSPEIKGDRATPVKILAFRPSLNFGARGSLLRLFQRHLAKLAYPTSRSGVYDAATGRAVLAYRKVNGLTRVETPSDGIIRAVLRDEGAYKVEHPNAGHHVEADISRQVLALIDGDKVVRVEPTSSGAPATPTVLGHYRFYSKTPGTNSKGMVYSNYFIRGYAIHGYASVPPYNASHGCLRIPIPDAIRVFNWIRLGDEIFVEP